MGVSYFQFSLVSYLVSLIVFMWFVGLSASHQLVMCMKVGVCVSKKNSDFIERSR